MRVEELSVYDFDCEGVHDIPKIKAVTEFTAEKWGRLIYWNLEEDPKNTCLHTFSYDYQFNSLWTNPDKWITRLKEFNCVLAPDFSMFIDMPKALQIYNHYRKHYVAALWQRGGIKVIPNICWSTPDSYDWCFDGEPKNSIVAISSVGCLKDPECKEYFLQGYAEMLKRLEPSQTIIYGATPDELKTENIIAVPSHWDQFKNKR